MLIIKNIDINLSTDEILESLCNNPHKTGDKKNTKKIQHHQTNVKGDFFVANIDNKISDIIELCLNKTRTCIRAKLLARWFDIKEVKNEKVYFIDLNKKLIVLDLGFSSKFLKEANTALFSVYTIGDELEANAAKASLEGDFLKSYIYDIIGLLYLKKIGTYVNEIVEKKAHDIGWGVGPFLSPGSVHGWELSGQNLLCSALPINEIDVEINEYSVLIPQKSLSCLIAIGSQYQNKKVGSTCDHCTSKELCQMKY